MNRRRTVLASIFSLCLSLVYCQEYMIDAEKQVPYAINEAKIVAKQGFDQPVFLFAEFMNGNETLVFRTENTAYTKEITAKYYSQGSIIALSLYLGSNKATLLAKQELQRPSAIDSENSRDFRNMDIKIPFAVYSVVQLKPLRYIPLVFLLLIIFIIALIHKKSKIQESLSLTEIIILSFAILAAGTMILLNSEKPSLTETASPDTIASRALRISANTEEISYLHIPDTNLEKSSNKYSYIIIRSCGNRRFPLAFLSDFKTIMFDNIPVIELTASQEYYLQKNTNIKAWAQYD